MTSPFRLFTLKPRIGKMQNKKPNSFEFGFLFFKKDMRKNENYQKIRQKLLENNVKLNFVAFSLTNF